MIQPLSVSKFCRTTPCLTPNFDSLLEPIFAENEFVADNDLTRFKKVEKIKKAKVNLATRFKEKITAKQTVTKTQGDARRDKKSCKRVSQTEAKSPAKKKLKSINQTARKSLKFPTKID